MTTHQPITYPDCYLLRPVADLDVHMGPWDDPDATTRLGPGWLLTGPTTDTDPIPLACWTGLPPGDVLTDATHSLHLPPGDRFTCWTDLGNNVHIARTEREYHELAVYLSDASGQPVRVVDLTRAEAEAIRISLGSPGLTQFKTNGAKTVWVNPAHVTQLEDTIVTRVLPVAWSDIEPHLSDVQAVTS